MTNYLAHMKLWLSAAVMAILVVPFLIGTPATQAYSANWQKGVSFQSRGTEDFASEDFKQSVRNASTLGVNHISLVVTHYQYGKYSSDLYRGWNTPSDASLTNATTFAKSLGIEVSYKLFVESNDGWRAYIQPGNKAQWFTQYKGIAVSLAKVAQASGAGMIVLGTEMVGVASAKQDPANTQYWYDLIGAVRKAYTGQLTYGGNWGGAYDEKNEIQFWDALDFIGVSAYYEPGRVGAKDAASIKKFWEGIDYNDLRPLSNKWKKEIILTEVGYRSTSSALDRPWDYGAGGDYNPDIQVAAYEGLLGYFNGVGYIKGIHMWDWYSAPWYGGQGNTDYTPWNKPAAAVMKKYYNGTGIVPTPAPTPAPTPTPVPTPNPTPTPAPVTTNKDLLFETSVTGLPESPLVGQEVALSATVKNISKSDATDAIVNVEIYQGSNRVYQNYVAGANIAINKTATYPMKWTPDKEGEYKVKVGVFSSNWSNLYSWFNEVKTITVAKTAVGGTPAPTTPVVPDKLPTPAPIPGKPVVVPTTPTTPKPLSEGESMIEVWWPGAGLNVNGVQPFKAILKNQALKDYNLFWQVGGDAYNYMYNAEQEYPHKESVVDLTSWNWNKNGTYEITFIAQDLQGKDTHKKTVSINVR
jgi:hypothetical protein